MACGSECGAFSMGYRQQARAEIAAVNKALREGYPPTVRSRNEKSAVRVAAEALKEERRSFTDRVGSPTKMGRWNREYGLVPTWSLYKPARNKFKKKTDTPEIMSPSESRFTAMGDEIRALRAALKDSHRREIEAEAVASIIKMVDASPRHLPRWMTDKPTKKAGEATPEVPMAIWCDWHIGEVVDAAEVNGYNRYDLKTAEERVHRLVDATTKLCLHNHTGVYPGMVVNLLGDFVSGGLHPELLKTDEEEILPSCLRAIDLIVGGLTRVADAMKRVYVPMTAGNHGRSTAKPEFKRYLYKNFDWLIYKGVQKHFEGDPRFQFDIRASNDVYYRVYGERYLALHGDMLGVKGGDGIIGAIGPIMRGEVKRSGQSSALGLTFDRVLMGHWHQRLWLPRAIVGNTIVGFTEFAKLQLGAKPDRATQPLWFVHPSHGKTASFDIYVDESPPPAQEWVSWQ